MSITEKLAAHFGKRLGDTLTAEEWNGHGLEPTFRQGDPLPADVAEDHLRTCTKGLDR